MIPFEYRLVTSYDAVEFATFINYLLSEGWGLYGDPYSRTDGLYVQAMVR